MIGFESIGGMMEKFKGFLMLIRLHNVIIACIACFTGYVVSARAIILSQHLYLSLLTVAMVSAGGYVINDYFDIDIDKVNKPYRPLPSGLFTPKFAYNLSMIFFIVGILSSIPLGPICLILAILNSLLMYYYSKRIKSLGFPGNMVIAFSSFSSILFGGLAYAQRVGELTYAAPSLLPGFYAFMIILGREIIKGIEDVEGDRIRGVKTLAIILGEEKAAIIASIIMFFVVLISPIPYITGLYDIKYLLTALIGVDIPIVFSITGVLRDARSFSPTARSMLKFSLFFGPVSFLLGII